jgi:uncharacterized protein
MSPAARLTTVALLTQLALAVAALVAARVTDRPIASGLDRPVLGVAVGGALAVLLAWVNYRWLFNARGWFRDVRTAVDEVLVPTFSVLSPPQIAMVSVAAGVGEELFFRGWLQPAIGWAPAALAFGAAHVAGARMLALGAWATAMGLVLGAAALVTGGLVAPIVAHACYDIAAFQYLVDVARRGSDQGV